MRILEPNSRVLLNVKYEGKNYTFESDIADPSTELDIDIAVAKRLGGASLESIPNTTYGYIYAIITLNHVIRKIPEEFPVEIESFEKIRDKEFVLKLFKEYKKKEDSFLNELKKNRDDRITIGRKESFRPLSDERVSHSTERSDTSGESIYPTETIHSGSNVEDRLSEPTIQDKTKIPEKSTGENETRRVPREYKPESIVYPGRRGRVYKRND
ncbi:hypothetical protein [Leptospira mayottensis]|uniref:Uncharacterized protein n=2 Tax=Leptospira mayottensis TaxID=1137606 RepID=A0AA87MLX5_9LEPT|nr:hypothetical protein [Leptospira mayottensis]AXR66628.1 hypothetical protein DQM28_20785 [Leptospira mayottensis]AZQ04270.1 hypothetical protein LEP1GSC190_19720 [Leptospira mayottensis 200901116]EKR98121.1 hypothetical protein LEP1GSC125_1544 [Leptospira mayottensis 200901122]TGN04329.1 hypothetical protein EHR03_10835 [Leptospira mayottensis]